MFLLHIRRCGATSLRKIKKMSYQPPKITLTRGDITLSYMDADGLLFYFSAYMRVAIENWEDDAYINSIHSALFHLDDAPETRFSCFSTAQKQCIRHFLEYMDAFLGSIEARKALEKHWKKT